MHNNSAISFCNIDTVNGSGDAFLAFIEQRVFNKNELFDLLGMQLKLPGYFGFNWDALYDCLCDFHWIQEYGIVLAHKTMPSLPLDDLKIYLEILQSTTSVWHDGTEHSFEVWFNLSDELFLKPLLGKL